MSEQGGLVECPVCGRPGKLYERKGKILVRHTEGSRVRWCYLRKRRYDFGKFIQTVDRMIRTVLEECGGKGVDEWCKDARASLSYVFRRIRWLAARDRDLEALLGLPPAEEAPQA